MTSTAAALLDVADRMRSGVGLARGLALTELSAERGLEEEPVGRLHDAVLATRESLAGPTLAATARCPRCSSVVEFELEIGRLRMLAPDGPASGRLVAGEYEVDWHAPTVADLIAVADGEEPGRMLRQRCVAASRHHVSIDVDSVPAAVMAEAERAMAAADPLAEVMVELECPECEHAFAADVDPIAFVAGEVERGAARIVGEVHELAVAYGWSEAAILALPDARRAAYLHLVRGGAS